MSKKILMATEGSHLLSGFGTYTKEVLSRLHKMGFEVAEFANFTTVKQTQQSNAPWKIYANAVDENDPRHKDYQSKKVYSYGAWRFDRVILDFKPDIVFSILDPWMMLYQGNSPFRPYFHWVIMPTVDSAPQKQEWIDGFMGADAVLAYEDWNLEVLRKHSNGRLPLAGTASPGVSLNIHKPMDKTQLKSNVDLPVDSFVIGSVMRNQKRKLYPDLFKAFAKYLELCIKNNRADLYEKSFLYIHTSYPDVGWDIPELLVEHGIGHKTLFSYVCKNCKACFPLRFQDAITTCIECNHVSATMPSVGLGYSPENMAQMFNIFDVYVQYATCLQPEQEVLTKNGWTEIQNINIGDTVWTHKNRWSKVTNTFKHVASNIIKEIKVYGDWETLQITDEHPVLAYTKDILNSKSTCSPRTILGIKLSNHQELPEPDFVPIEKLSINDLLVQSINDEVIDIQNIDIVPYMNTNYCFTDNKIKSKTNNKYYNTYLDTNSDFYRFIGLFVADGHAGKGSIKITCHNQEKSNIDLSKSVLSQICNYKVRKYNKRNAQDICINSVLHSNFFRLNCYTKDKEKKLPEWCMYLPIDKQKKILHGLFMGDGCYNHLRNRNVSLYCTTSNTLAKQINIILKRCRIYFSTRISYKKGNRKPQYIFEIPGNLKNGEFDRAYVRKNSKNLYYKNYYISSIKSIKDIDYSKDNVYNIEVEHDNSYVTRMCTVHNCEGLGMSQPEAAACGTPVMAVNYSAMESIVEKTKGVPLKVDRMFRELETGADRAYPDNDYLANKLYEYVNQSADYKKNKSKQARKAAEQYYNWDRTAEKWADIFNKLPPRPLNWNSPPRLFSPAQSYDPSMSNTEFVKFLYEKVLNEPEKAYGYAANVLLRDMNYGVSKEGDKHTPIDRDKIFQSYLARAKFNNEHEMIRIGKLPIISEDYITVANERMKYIK